MSSSGPSGMSSTQPKSQMQTFRKSVEKFFGFVDDEDEEKKKLQDKWKANATRMHARSVLLHSGKRKTGPLSAEQFELTQRSSSTRAQQYESAPEAFDDIDSGSDMNTADVDWLSVDKRSKRMLRKGKPVQPPMESAWNILTKKTDEIHLIRSLKPASIMNFEPDGSRIDISFFDKPVSTGTKQKLKESPMAAAAVDYGTTDETDSSPLLSRHRERECIKTKNNLLIPNRPETMRGIPRAPKPPSSLRTVEEGEKEGESADELDGPFRDAATFVTREFIEEIIDNTNRHEVGIGLLGSCLGLRRKKKLDVDVEERLAEMDANPYRPYFTYWVTFVQIVSFIVSVSVYGIATPGGAMTTITGEVLTSSLSIEQVSYSEDSNFWIGPRQADLIHLGAKYSPCMRDDENVRKAIEIARMNESNSGCCVLNDGSGCLQTEEARCSKSLATWMKWTKNSTGPDGRLSGSVCGQDPRFCKSPASTGAYVWPDNIAKWPVCEVTANVTSKDEMLRHMTVPLAGRPCCIGVQGQCVITTREFCDFRRGYFHEEANLCSQVSCLSEICGMIPFHNPEKPDQFYRLWISLFIHAGIFQLLLSVVFQLVLMRDLEKYLGWLRICIIYCVCGIAGSLGSAIFIPYHVEAGPSGSQFGLLAIFFVEIIQHWSTLENARWGLTWLIVITIFLFAVGLLPMIDNYAHLIGFVFGFPLGFALMRDVWFGLKNKTAKVISVICCILFTLAGLATLIVLFYVVGVYQCPNCQWFNCVPLTPTFCRTSEVKIISDDNY